MSETPPITDNQSEHRFEATIDGYLAELVYRRSDDRLTLVHTGVPDELEGKGLGGALVRAAVHKAAAEGWTVVPQCSFARHWLKEHPDVAERVAIDWPVARS